MRSTVVPAQVTTVEDRIMGSLGFSQLALVVLPVFITAAVFAFVPPFMQGSVFKYVVCAVVAILMSILAIRIKGKIVLFWLITIARFKARPKLFLFSKTTAAFRDDTSKMPEEVGEESNITDHQQLVTRPRLELQDSARVFEAIDKPNSNFRFEMSKKGGLRVRFSQIED